MAFQLDIGFCTHTGQRSHNEDFAACHLPARGSEDWGAIAAVADGVSRGGEGAAAAQTSVLALLHDYYATPATWDTTVALDRLISAHNSWLHAINQRRHPALGLCTLTALVLRGHTYTVAHVGDTRAYLVRDGQWQCLTHDHVVPHVDFSHQLVRAIGLEDRISVDYLQGELQHGDCFVLLSDGVHGSLPARALPAAFSHARAQDNADALVQAARKAGSSDNLTAVVVQAQGLPAATLRDAQHSLRDLDVPAHLRLGETLDGLQVTATVADNGINVLYQVRHGHTLYALKTLHPARAHDPEERAMLVHEHWLAQQLQSTRASTQLVRSHRLLPDGQAPSKLYILYDWHSGQTLEQLRKLPQRCTVPQVLEWGLQALRVLGVLHRQGVVHRDIKPANLHWGDDGVLRLLDLGVALSGRESAAQRSLHAGTPSYINPEQWGYRARTGTSDDTQAQAPNAQSDLYALGVTLYQLLTGKLPYGEVLPYQVGRYHRDPTPPSRHNPEVPIWLNHVLLKAVARDQRQRFETAEEFRLALERGASRPLNAPHDTPLLQRDPTVVWKLATGLLGLVNLLLAYWLLFLPK
jgi:serine/threonine protein phosphatase PrpC